MNGASYRVDLMSDLLEALMHVPRCRMPSRTEHGKIALGEVVAAAWSSVGDSVQHRKDEGSITLARSLT